MGGGKKKPFIDKKRATTYTLTFAPAGGAGSDNDVPPQLVPQDWDG